MKEFNLKEFKKTPSQKVITRDGREVRIICTDAKGTQPIIALITNNNKENLRTFYKNGKWSNTNECNLDLFFASIKREGWVNLYKGILESYLPSVGQKVYKSKEDAIRNKCSERYFTTLKIEWEE